MPAAYTNLYLEQGTTFTSTVTIDDVYGELYDLSGYQAFAQIRKSYYSTNVTADFVATIDSLRGTITLNLDAATTANISPGRYVYDAVIKDDQITTRILEGIIDVSPMVTR